MTTPWVLASEAVDDGALTLLRMQSTHGLSRLFEVVVELQPSGDDDVVQANLDALLVGRAYVAADGQAEDKLWGVFRSIELLTTEPGVKPTYRAVLVPRLWYATQTRRSRVFQQLSVPQIVARVLDVLGFVGGQDYAMALQGSYPTREYVVQYEETDYAFVSRLLEDEGIAFRFEQGDEREKVVFTDANGSFPRPDALADVRYHEGASVPDGVVYALTRKREAVPGQVLLADYDWRKPSVELLYRATVDAAGRGLVFSGAQHYRDGQYGQRLARIRAEELLVGRDVFRGRSTLGAMLAGDVLRLHGHFRSELDGDYLVVEVQRRFDQAFDGSQRGDATAGRGNDFVAIAMSVTYRPPRTTPRPRIDGLLYATVDGPELGTPAPIDEQGRYKVVLPFDLEAEAGGKASRWIRMAQPLSGPGFGVHFPLREGAEVVLSHVQGDPDRPIIVGAVPNTQTPSPVTRANATQSVIRTSSGIHLEFEDDA